MNMQISKGSFTLRAGKDIRAGTVSWEIKASVSDSMLLTGIARVDAGLTASRTALGVGGAHGNDSPEEVIFAPKLSEKES